MRGATRQHKFQFLVANCMAAILVLFAFCVTSRAEEPAAEDVLRLYNQFVAAQNRRDLAAVRELLSERADFLWISDGKPFWGRDAMIERMAAFQKAETWRVEPEYEHAKVVPVGTGSAYLHIPLVLVLGSAGDPRKLKWLVAVLCVREAETWKIAALFTTEDRRPQ